MGYIFVVVGYFSKVEREGRGETFLRSTWGFAGGEGVRSCPSLQQQIWWLLKDLKWIFSFKLLDWVLLDGSEMLGCLHGLDPLKLWCLLKVTHVPRVFGLRKCLVSWHGDGLIKGIRFWWILDVLVLILELSNLQQLRTLSYSETAEEEHSISMMRTVSSGTGQRLLEEINMEQFTWPKNPEDIWNLYQKALQKEHPLQPNDVLRSMLALQVRRRKLEIQGSRREMLHVASDFNFGEGFRMVAKITKAVQVSPAFNRCSPRAKLLFTPN